MKKNILFIMPSLHAGGGEKSLVNLLSNIDYSAYKVDLLLLKQEGLFMSMIPKEVSIVPLNKDFHYFSLPFFQSLSQLVAQRNFKLIYGRFIFTFLNRIIKNPSYKEQRTWRYYSKSLNELDKEYDAAIGYMEKTPIYLCVDKVKAKRKIGWIHTDYKKMNSDPSFDEKYFEKLHSIITVSETCAEVLQNQFPKEKNKVKVIPNMISDRLIKTLSEEDVKESYMRESEYTLLLSVGRLTYLKGFDLAIEACRILVEKGYKVKWYVIGEGEERKKLERLIEKNGLKRHFYLLGLRANPYPYIVKSDLFVHPSRYEGKSIAIDEAKSLFKPVLVTNYHTAKDQINHMVNGMIVDMTASAISQGIETLINQPSLRSQFIKHLSYEKESLSHKAIENLYEMI